MGEQNINHDEVLKDAELDQVSGGAIMHDASVIVHDLRKQEQADKLTSAKEQTGK